MYEVLQIFPKRLWLQNIKTWLILANMEVICHKKELKIGKIATFYDKT
jgi:hypothetical protein